MICDHAKRRARPARAPGTVTFAPAASHPVGSWPLAIAQSRDRHPLFPLVAVANQSRDRHSLFPLVAVANQGSDSLSLWFLSFTVRIDIDVGGLENDVAIGDFNDGKRDLAAARVTTRSQSCSLANPPSESVIG